MNLSERKIIILQAIIRNYLETGEPVGSRTISKYSDLNLSSATIRNEMADLEEMGYIIQPHTSAGRIPSQAGYRYYIDNWKQTGWQITPDGYKYYFSTSVTKYGAAMTGKGVKIGGKYYDFTNDGKLIDHYDSNGNPVLFRSRNESR